MSCDNERNPFLFGPSYNPAEKWQLLKETKTFYLHMHSCNFNIQTHYNE